MINRRMLLQGAACVAAAPARARGAEQALRAHAAAAGLLYGAAAAVGPLHNDAE